MGVFGFPTGKRTVMSRLKGVQQVGKSAAAVGSRPGCPPSQPPPAGRKGDRHAARSLRFFRVLTFSSTSYDGSNAAALGKVSSVQCHGLLLDT